MILSLAFLFPSHLLVSLFQVIYFKLLITRLFFEFPKKVKVIRSRLYYFLEQGHKFISFGLEQVQSLKDTATHPRSKFKGVPAPRFACYFWQLKQKQLRKTFPLLHRRWWNKSCRFGWRRCQEVNKQFIVFQECILFLLASENVWAYLLVLIV